MSLKFIFGNNDYWSCTWQPVGKSLDDYKCECHHGTAYTTVKSEYSGMFGDYSSFSEEFDELSEIDEEEEE